MDNIRESRLSAYIQLSAGKKRLWNLIWCLKIIQILLSILPITGSQPPSPSPSPHFRRHDPRRHISPFLDEIKQDLTIVNPLPLFFWCMLIPFGFKIIGYSHFENFRLILWTFWSLRSKWETISGPMRPSIGWDFGLGCRCRILGEDDQSRTQGPFETMEFLSHLPSTSPSANPLRPTLFELIAQDQLRDLIQPALRYVISVYAPLSSLR